MQANDAGRLTFRVMLKKQQQYFIWTVMNRNLFLLWQGQFVSQFGSQAYSIAMMFYLMQTTGSATLMGTIMTLSVIPAILMTPIAGVFADSLSRRTIIIVTDILRGLVVLSIAALLYFKPQDHGLIIIGFAIAALVSGVCRAFFDPAIMAVIVDLADKDKLNKVNGLFQSTSQFTQIVGQAAGGVLYKVLGAPLLLLIDGISYLLSAFSEAFIQVPEQNQSHQKSVKQALADFKLNFKAGFAFVRATKGMLGMMLFVASINFFVAPIVLLMPFYVELQLGADVKWYGFVMAGFGTGILTGAVLAAKLDINDKNRAFILQWMIMLLGLSVGALAFIHNVWLALMMLFLSGVAIGLFNVPSMTLFQTQTPKDMLGRVMSLLTAIVTAAMPLGFLISGILTDWLDKNIAIIFACVGGSVVLSTLYIKSRPEVTNFMSATVTLNAEK